MIHFDSIESIWMCIELNWVDSSTKKTLLYTQTRMAPVCTSRPATSDQSLFNPIMDLSLVTMNPSPTDASFSIYTQQQSKPFILHGIMDVVVCWIGLIGLKCQSQFHESQQQTDCWRLCCTIYWLKKWIYNGLLLEI